MIAKIMQLSGLQAASLTLGYLSPIYLVSHVYSDTYLSMQYLPTYLGNVGTVDKACKRELCSFCSPWMAGTGSESAGGQPECFGYLFFLSSRKGTSTLP